MHRDALRRIRSVQREALLWIGSILLSFPFGLVFAKGIEAVVPPTVVDEAYRNAQRFYQFIGLSNSIRWNWALATINLGFAMPFILVCLICYRYVFIRWSIDCWRRSDMIPLCPNCSYLLVGCPSSRCPECGTTIPLGLAIPGVNSVSTNPVIDRNTTVDSP
jgi:hypothetical protein